LLQARKQAKRLLALAKAQRLPPLTQLAQALDVIAQLRGQESWHALVQATPEGSVALSAPSPAASSGLAEHGALAPSGDPASPLPYHGLAQGWQAQGPRGQRLDTKLAHPGTCGAIVGRPGQGKSLLLKSVLLQRLVHPQLPRLQHWVHLDVEGAPAIEDNVFEALGWKGPALTWSVAQGPGLNPLALPKGTTQPSARHRACLIHLLETLVAPTRWAASMGADWLGYWVDRVYAPSPRRTRVPSPGWSDLIRTVAEEALPAADSWEATLSEALFRLDQAIAPEPLPASVHEAARNDLVAALKQVQAAFPTCFASRNPVNLALVQRLRIEFLGDPQGGAAPILMVRWLACVLACQTGDRLWTIDEAHRLSGSGGTSTPLGPLIQRLHTVDPDLALLVATQDPASLLGRHESLWEEVVALAPRGHYPGLDRLSEVAWWKEACVIMDSWHRVAGPSRSGYPDAVVVRQGDPTSLQVVRSEAPPELTAALNRA
jgi:hypothetical protein